MNKDDVNKLFKSYVETAGSQASAARQLGVSAQHVADILRGRREPGPRVLDALGIERTIEFRQKEQTT